MKTVYSCFLLLTNHPKEKQMTFRLPERTKAERTLFSLRPDTVARLRKLKDETGYPMSQVVDAAINQFLDQAEGNQKEGD